MLENWEQKDIKFKDLMELGFPLPEYYFTRGFGDSVENFNFSGL